jgi:hypothetical protein
MMVISHRKKKVREFPVPSRDVTTKLSLGGNNDVITELFLPRGSLVSDIPAGDGKLANIFLRSIHRLSCLACPRLQDACGAVAGVHEVPARNVECEVEVPTVTGILAADSQLPGRLDEAAVLRLPVLQVPDNSSSRQKSTVLARNRLGQVISSRF